MAETAASLIVNVTFHLFLAYVVIEPALANGLSSPQHKVAPRPQISIVIDDLGHRWHDGLRAAALPGRVTLAILPNTPFARSLAEAAQDKNKEIIVHMPMEPIDKTQQRVSHSMLTANMNREELITTLRGALKTLPEAVGLNNHMGSLLTQTPALMNWLMTELKRKPRLFFIDSRTSEHSVALRIAKSHNLPSLSRDVFLDHHRDATAIERQFHHLVAKAYQKGFALAIGHPYRETLAVLEHWLPQLDEYGVELIFPSEYLFAIQPRGVVADLSAPRNLR